MDIQEMVDLRIAEIQSRTNGTSAARRNPEFEIEGNSKSRLTNNTFNSTVFEEKPKLLHSNFQNRFDDCSNATESVANLDQTLAQVAAKMLDITETIAGDYGRLENDILKSRLAVLQSAESILDIAVSLRKKAMDLGAELAHRQQGCRQGEPVSEGTGDYKSLYSVKGRASMHRHGVAALFKRT